MWWSIWIAYATELPKAVVWIEEFSPKNTGVYQLSYLGGSSTQMSLNALRESVYHFFYAESGYSYNARYLTSYRFFGNGKDNFAPTFSAYLKTCLFG